MNDRTVATARVSQRAKSARRGGPSGRQVVGEYVGQPAGDAAQAVRRAGLCPGLDRSFGCEAELIGLVVAQEPVAGSDLAQWDGVLYVATPRSGPVEVEPSASETVSDSPVPGPVASVAPEVEPFDASSTPRSVRRREPGLARQTTQVFDSPPAPMPPQQAPAEEARLARECGFLDGVYALGASDDGEFDEGPLEDQGEGELVHDEFVVHLDDVLAGRADRPPAWLGEHSLLVKAVGAALAVWVLIGLVSALDG
jgi:hypothetical protein